MRDAGRGRRPHARGSGRGGSCPPTPGSGVGKCLRFKLPGPRRFFTVARDTGTGTPVIGEDQWP